MTTYMYCLYVGFDYTYIDVNALAQEIKTFLASQVWLTETSLCIYMCVCVRECVRVCVCVCVTRKSFKIYSNYI